MIRDSVGDLVAFLAVARNGSFTSAAKQLGVSQPALSRTLRELEDRLGLRLLNRTTRHVATTEAGEKLLRSIAPHFDGIEAGLADLTDLRDRPAGTVRITTGDHQAEAILLPTLARLLPRYPDLHVEVSVDLGFVDLIAERFDAGIRLGETLAQDMVAVRIAPDMRMSVVGSPAYFAGRPRPQTPGDLAAHNCIGLRFPTHGGVAVWEFEKAGRALNVRIEGQLIVNNNTLARLAAVDGMGLAFLPAEAVKPLIATGELLEVLAEWCEPFPGYHLYYPSRRQPSAAFTAVVDALRFKG